MVSRQFFAEIALDNKICFIMEIIKSTLIVIINPPVDKFASHSKEI